MTRAIIENLKLFRRWRVTAIGLVVMVVAFRIDGGSYASAQAFIPVRPVPPQPEEMGRFQQQVRGLIQQELNLVATVIKPSDKQALALVNLAESQWEAASLREVTRRVQHHVHGSIDFDGLVERSVSMWCKDVLNEDQVATYQAEIQDRQDLRKEALIARMLIWLQKKLSLSASQTDQVEKVLRERWKDRWYRSVEATFANETLLPEINQKWLEDILTTSQKNALVVRAPTEKNIPMLDVFPTLPLSKRFSLGGIESDSVIPLKETDVPKNGDVAPEASR